MKRTVDEARNGSVVLELVKGSLQHVLRVDFLDSKQVQHHVVSQSKSAVQWVRLTLYDIKITKYT